MNNSNELKELYSQVGFIVISWGHCEQSLELLVNSLHMEHEGNKLPGRKKMPKQLSEKLKFVNECASSITQLSPFKNELEKLVSDFGAIIQMRHDLIHGAPTDDPVVNGVFNFIRLQANSDIHEVKPFQYDLNSFPRISKILARLGADAPKVARRVFEAGRMKP